MSSTSSRDLDEHSTLISFRMGHCNEESASQHPLRVKTRWPTANALWRSVTGIKSPHGDSQGQMGGSLHLAPKSRATLSPRQSYPLTALGSIFDSPTIGSNGEEKIYGGSDSIWTRQNGTQRGMVPTGQGREQGNNLNNLLNAQVRHSGESQHSILDHLQQPWGMHSLPELSLEQPNGEQQQQARLFFQGIRTMSQGQDIANMQGQQRQRGMDAERTQPQWQNVKQPQSLLQQVRRPQVQTLNPTHQQQLKMGEERHVSRMHVQEPDDGHHLLSQVLHDWQQLHEPGDVPHQQTLHAEEQPHRKQHQFQELRNWEQLLPKQEQPMRQRDLAQEQTHMWQQVQVQDKQVMWQNNQMLDHPLAAGPGFCRQLYANVIQPQPQKQQQAQERRQQEDVHSQSSSIHQQQAQEWTQQQDVHFQSSGIPQQQAQEWRQQQEMLREMLALQAKSAMRARNSSSAFTDKGSAVVQADSKPDASHMLCEQTLPAEHPLSGWAAVLGNQEERHGVVTSGRVLPNQALHQSDSPLFSLSVASPAVEQPEQAYRRRSEGPASDPMALQPASKSEEECIDENPGAMNMWQGCAKEVAKDLSSDAAVSSQRKGIQDLSRKVCNCKKSQCLKLYCECFAAGLFCSNCHCISCENTSERAGLVARKREQIIRRDPRAFSGKIAEGKGSAAHKKGCNCKRSFCLKKYCECFQGGVKCGEACKCLNCKNNVDPATSEVHLQTLTETNTELPGDGDVVQAPSLKAEPCGEPPQGPARQHPEAAFVPAGEMLEVGEPLMLPVSGQQQTRSGSMTSVVYGSPKETPQLDDVSVDSVGMPMSKLNDQIPISHARPSSGDLNCLPLDLQQQRAPYQQWLEQQQGNGMHAEVRHTSSPQIWADSRLCVKPSQDAWLAKRKAGVLGHCYSDEALNRHSKEMRSMSMSPSSSPQAYHALSDPSRSARPGSLSTEDREPTLFEQILHQDLFDPDAYLARDQFAEVGMGSCRIAARQDAEINTIKPFQSNSNNLAAHGSEGMMQRPRGQIQVASRNSLPDAPWPPARSSTPELHASAGRFPPIYFGNGGSDPGVKDDLLDALFMAENLDQPLHFTPPKNRMQQQPQNLSMIQRFASVKGVRVQYGATKFVSCSQRDAPHREG